MKKEIDTFKVRGINVANVHNQSGIVFFGIACLSGSSYETPEVAGISHFSEHLFFKGTKNRNWKRINEDFAKVGANYNAYTSNIEVLYYFTCPKESLKKSINILNDLFFNSTFPKDEMEKERTVILEEKKMCDDDPNYAFNSEIGKKMLSWQVGHEAIGTNETINSITRDQVISYLNSKIDLDNLVFVCVGDVDSADLLSYLEENIPENHECFKNGKGLHKIDLTDFWRKDFCKKPNKVKFTYEREAITQSSVQMYLESLSDDDPLRYAEAVLYKAIGGGSYSRLFSRIREELGLCYEIGMYSYLSVASTNKMGVLYGATSTEKVQKLIRESEKILGDVKNNGISKDVFECAKTDLLASFLRKTETSEGKSAYITRNFLLNKSAEKASIEKKIRDLKQVRIGDCNDAAQKILSKPFHWCVMNPKK